jgi:RNA polymerase sigma factor (TIGR02999 family)
MAEDIPLTLLLRQAHAGNPQAADQAYALLYPELLKIARARLRVHRAPTLLDTHALVHESFLRFVGGAAAGVESRKHFYAYAAKAMRHIVIDFVRRAQAERRGGDLAQVTFDTAVLNASADAHEATPVAEVEDALQALQALDAELATVVEMRFYGGYSDAEIGQALGLGERSVRRLWDKARAFLLLHLGQA